MKKHLITIISIFCIIFTLSCFICSANAVGLGILEDPNKFIQSEEGKDNKDAIEIANVIVWLVRTIGESIAVIILLVIGIKYILGSVEEKAEYKQSMIPYIIGAALIFTGAALTDLIYNAFN